MEVLVSVVMRVEEAIGFVVVFVDGVAATPCDGCSIEGLSLGLEALVGTTGGIMRIEGVSVLGAKAVGPVRGVGGGAVGTA